MASYTEPPPMLIDEEKIYKAVIVTENGEIELELYPRYAPMTVNNFVFLAKEGFYDGLSFHRVIPGFVIQGGDPTGTGMGGPGYTFGDEMEGNPLVHETGAVSMANSGPDTNGSQFFITRSPQHHLDGHHTVFGRVISGQDIVDSMVQGERILKVLIGEIREDGTRKE